MKAPGTIYTHLDGYAWQKAGRIWYETLRQAGALPRGAADVRRYMLTIEHSGRRHTVELSDLVDDPALQALLDYLRARAREWRTRR